MKELKLEYDKDISLGRYANLAVIAHTKDEFIIDFAFAYPGQSPRVNARVVVSPQHAKALMRSLEDNIRKFESRFGAIPEAQLRQGGGEQN
ncbi:DUF3467 domain-containing protein [soil metagenome]|nr:DUF3467 domain-containing protein [Deinococcota bacterium]